MIWFSVGLLPLVWERQCKITILFLYVQIFNEKKAKKMNFAK